MADGGSGSTTARANNAPQRRGLAGVVRALGTGHLRDLHRLTLQALGSQRPLLAGAVALALVSGLLQTMLLFAIAMIAVAISRAPGAPPLFDLFRTRPIGIQPLLVGATLLAGGVTALTPPTGALQARLSSRAITEVRRRLVTAYLASSLDYRLRHREGYFQQLVAERCERFSMSVQNLVSIYVTGAMLAMLIVGPALLNWKIGLAEIVLIALSFGLLVPLTRRRRGEGRRRGTVTDALASDATQITRLADEIEILNVGAKVARDMRERIDQVSGTLRRIYFHDASVPQVYQYGLLTGLLAVLAALFLVYPGQHPSLSALALVLIRVLTFSRQLLALTQQWLTNAPAIEEIDAELANLEAHRAVHGAVADFRFDGLALDGVSFGYGASAPLLDAVTLTVAKGEVIGIVGPSGAGKSSLCALLTRLRTPAAGRITSGGIDIGDIAPERWGAAVGYVPQEPRLLHASVADNILFYRDVPSRAAIARAAAAANLHTEILALPDGYETQIGPGARGLSGGQRQRLSIARALLGEPQLLVLDEPSSALDQESELLIGATLAALKGKTSIVIVTHRPAVLHVCDRVLRLEAGRLVPTGQSVAAAGERS